MVKKNILNALFYELHKAIRESANTTIDKLNIPEISYPPGIELTEEEISALKDLNLSITAKSALAKLMIDACSYPSFHLFSLLDGVVDPESDEIDDWYGLSFCKRKDEEEMLHDNFLESYHAFNEKN